MKHLVLILLAATLSINVACSKKKSGGGTVATAPPVAVDPNNPYNPGTYYPGFPAPQNAKYHYGSVQIIKPATYVSFLKSAFYYQTYQQQGNYYGQQANGSSYNYSYSCDFNIFRWLFEGQALNCNSGGQSQFDNYVQQLVYQQTMVQLLFLADGTVKGLWLAGASMDGAGNMYAYEQIPFRGRISQLHDGRLIVDAGPIVLLSTGSYTNFDIYFNESTLGNVTIR